MKTIGLVFPKEENSNKKKEAEKKETKTDKKKGLI